MSWSKPFALACLTLSADAAGAGAAQDPPRKPANVALVGETIIDGTGAAPVADATVLVEGDKIRVVGRVYGAWTESVQAPKDGATQPPPAPQTVIRIGIPDFVHPRER